MSPGRVRDELLSVAGRLARDGETQLKHSPENPGRFSLNLTAMAPPAWAEVIGE